MTKIRAYRGEVGGPSRAQHGASLIIVLAFVVLLSGIVIAMLVLSMSNLKLSKNYAEQIKVNLFASGAADIIIGDLRQEIVAGSTASATFADGSTLYVPNSAAKAVPERVGTDDAWPNLVKRSKAGAPFYTGPGAVARAAPAPSSTASLNGRALSAERWNKAYLLPKKDTTSDTDATPANNAAGTAFEVPDWVMVTRSEIIANSGNFNPTTWSADYSAKGSNPVLGRFAYAIYDEGGLLDANVAGYPNGSNGSTAAQINSKPALAYADLTHLKDSSGNPLLTTTQIDQLVAWRNYATLSPTGFLPAFGFSSGAGSSYYSYVLSNLKGFLAVGNTKLVSGQSDHLFSSRQELQKFLLQSLAVGQSDRAKMQQVLQYLGTFSRDINQPSFVPDPARPKVNPLSKGGNLAFSFDDTINPSFLSVRVQTTKSAGRNDGSDLTQGEPLVKKRFALNRLAWLTYLGPSSQHMGDQAVQKSITALGGNPTDTNDPIYKFVAMGTPQNIYNYFGLTWLSVAGANMWVYNHAGSAPLATFSAGSGPIKALAGVATANREPDFIELLKAGIHVGSLGKASTSSSAPSPTFLAHYNRDISVDLQVIQIAANIMDQFDADGYPTTIYFNDGAGFLYYGMYNWSLPGLQIHGIENLPYLNRMRCGLIKASLPVPYGTTAKTNGKTWTPFADTGNDSSPLTQTGVGFIMQFPEIWNPHDWNSANLPQTIGVVQPTSFRVIAESDPSYGGFASWSHNGATATPAVNSKGATATDPSSVWYSGQFGSMSNPPSRTLTSTNSEMDFTIPATAAGAALFREPTVLFKPDMPSGSGLSSSAITTANTGVPSTYIGNSGSSSGFKSAVADPGRIGDSASQIYIGFYEGPFPLQYVTGSGAAAQVYPMRQTQFSGSPPTMVRLQYKDINNVWVSYDDKYCPNLGFGDEVMKNQQGTFIGTARGDGFDGTVDPRSTRFSVFHHYLFNGYGWLDFSPYSNGGWSGVSGGPVYLSGANGILETQRRDNAAGAVMFDNGNTSASWAFPDTMGWWPGQNIFKTSNGSAGLRIGLLAQNSPNATNDAKIGASATNTGADTQSQFYADADGVVRRATAAWVISGGGHPASSSLGLPTATAHSFSGVALNRNAAQSISRPMILNRPFHSVAELGYVFKGTPWKNLDFLTPESGDAPLLDVFCVNDNGDSSGMVAGKVNLNTRQYSVLQAVLAGGYQDEWTPTPGLTTATGDPAKLAAALVARTTGQTVNGQTAPGVTAQPLANMGELVGKWVSSQTTSVSGATAPNNVDGSKSYGGFIGDSNITTLLGANNVIQRYREAVVRPLAAVGTTRVWNLMIDVVAQTGSYPQTGSTFNQFQVDGEQRYWVHVAIDRYTGRIIDKQIEVVSE